MRGPRAAWRVAGRWRVRPTRGQALALAGLAAAGAGVLLACAPPRSAGRALALLDAERLGTREQALWEAYYLRQWPRLFRLLLAVTREQFGLSYAQALYAAYLGTRAQLDAVRQGPGGGGAEAAMRAFYTFVRGPTGGRYDPARAAAKEVRWWVVHRDAAHHTAESRALEDAFTDLYVELYQARPDAVRPAAQARARAVALSDRWLDAGMPRPSPLLGEIRAELIRGYHALRAAVAPS